MVPTRIQDQDPAAPDLRNDFARSEALIERGDEVNKVRLGEGFDSGNPSAVTAGTVNEFSVRPRYDVARPPKERECPHVVPIVHDGEDE